MVFAEIRPQIEKLPREEMLKALAFLKHRLRADDPVYQADLARRHADLVIVLVTVEQCVTIKIEFVFGTQIGCEKRQSTEDRLKCGPLERIVRPARLCVCMCV
jgi:hypothetical protein